MISRNALINIQQNICAASGERGSENHPLYVLLSNIINSTLHTKFVLVLHVAVDLPPSQDDCNDDQLCRSGTVVLRYVATMYVRI